MPLYPEEMSKSEDSYAMSVLVNTAKAKLGSKVGAVHGVAFVRDAGLYVYEYHGDDANEGSDDPTATTGSGTGTDTGTGTGTDTGTGTGTSTTITNSTTSTTSTSTSSHNSRRQPKAKSNTWGRGHFEGLVREYGVAGAISEDFMRNEIGYRSANDFSDSC